MGSSMAAGAGLGAGLAAGGAAVMGTMAGSLGGFLTMGGGMLAGIGALTGDKDLQKFGSILTLVGGIGNLAAPSLFGKTGGAAGAADAASSGGEAAAEAASSVTESVAPQAINTPSAALGKIDQLGQLGSLEPSMPAFKTPDLMGGGGGAQAAAASSAAPAAPSLWDKALGGQTVVGTNPLDASMGMGGAQIAGYSMPDPLTAGASSLTGGEVNSLLKVAADKAKSTLTGIPGFIRENKELVGMAGNALATMYGPQAEALDWQKSLYARRKANLNNPVRLGIVPGG